MSENVNPEAPKVEIPENEKVKEEFDLGEDLKEFGQKLSETLKTAWNSEERKKIESEIRDGLKTFGEEVDQAAKKFRESEMAQKMNEGAAKVREELKEKEVTYEVKKGLVSALRSLQEVLDKLADKFTVDEEPKE